MSSKSYPLRFNFFLNYVIFIVKIKRKVVEMLVELKDRIKELNNRLEILRGYL